MPAVGEHYRPTDGTTIYRVVGTAGPITLLRVTDGDGRRVHDGDLRQVSVTDFDESFERTDDPDAGFTPRRALRNALQGVYWQVPRFLP